MKNNDEGCIISIIGAFVMFIIGKSINHQINTFSLTNEVVIHIPPSSLIIGWDAGYNDNNNRGC
jgi:hypothetical protein